MLNVSKYVTKEEKNVVMQKIYSLIFFVLQGLKVRYNGAAMLCNLLKNLFNLISFVTCFVETLIGCVERRVSKKYPKNTDPLYQALQQKQYSNATTVKAVP